MNSVTKQLNIYKSSLNSIPTFKSVAIGLERGLGSKDAPFARILPITHTPNGTSELLTFSVVFGFDSKNRDYEELHEKYFEAESEILNALKPYADWIETVTDEDSVPNLKTAVITFKGEMC